MNEAGKHRTYDLILGTWVVPGLSRVILPCLEVYPDKKINRQKNYTISRLNFSYFRSRLLISMQNR